MRRLLVLLQLFISIALFANQNSVITRGPYLQSGTETSMIIRWRTATPVICGLNYGTQFNQQTLIVTDTVATVEHELKITGLQPFTKYFYSIYHNITLLAGNDSSYYFVTNPVAGTVQPVHLWVTGDMGRANQEQTDVRDEYWNNIKAGRHTDSWIWLGDNVYSSGTDQEYQDKMFAIYPEIMRNTVSRPTPGNHDYGSVNAVTHDGPYYQNFTMTKNGEAGGVQSNEEGYYSYNYGNVHFVSLNSENLLWYISSTSAMANWLRADLMANTQPFVIAYWHQPPYTKGSHDSDDAFGHMYFMRTNIVPILEQYGVDVVLTGHSHNYERTWLLKGHYGDAASFNFTHQVSAASGKISDNTPYVKYTTGPNANEGTVYVVCGNGGSSTSGQPLNHPAMYFSQQDSVGFMTIDVNGLQLDAKYFDRNGIMWDNFTIQKTAQNPNGQLALVDVVKELKIYPNPYRNFLQMEYTIDMPQQLTIEMFDINGKLIQQLFNGIAKEGKNQHTGITDGLAKGNYIVKIKSSKLGEVNKVVTLQ